jgi:hypothetical protein
MSSKVRGIFFFGVAPLLAILGGMLWSDFFALDTPQHPASWEYTAGPILFFIGLAAFVAGIIYAASAKKNA